MTHRGGEFAPLGAVGLRALGVPAKRAREIETERAWAKIAGKATARRVRVVAFARGVLLLEAADRAWIEATRPHVPRLARSLAREFPQLGLKKIRLTLAGGGTSIEAESGGPESAPDTGPVRTEGPPRGSTPSGRGRSAADRR